MKKMILVWAMMLSVGMSASFANFTETVSQQVINAFKKEFSEAQNVSWEISKNFTKASFTLHDQVLYAYYSKDGELTAVTRNILSDQLPINLLTSLKKGYGQYWITDLFEMAASGSTSYYVTLHDGAQQLILKSSGSTGWEIFKKEKKNIQ